MPCPTCKSAEPIYEPEKRRCWKCNSRKCAACGFDTGSILIKHCVRCQDAEPDVYDSEGNVDPYNLPTSTATKPQAAAPEVPAVGSVSEQCSEEPLPPRRKNRRE